MYWKSLATSVRSAPTAARIHAHDRRRGFSTVFRANRLMGLNEANPAKNVHGGHLLRFMADDAGFIAALRHLNSIEKEGKFTAALASVSRTAFLKPVHVGELVEAEAQVIFTSRRSLVVQIDLHATNLLTEFRRRSNSTLASYVAIDFNESKEFHVSEGPVPLVDLKAVPEKLRKRGEDQYTSLKEARKARAMSAATLMKKFLKEDWNAYLAHILGPTDVFVHNNVAQGGLILKLMDEVGAVSAFKHCKSNCVTASIETLRFREPISLGDVVSLVARPTFASKKSLEVEIIVEASNPFSGESWIAAHAFFVFVALDNGGKAKEIPPLRNHDDDAQQRYLQRKAKRI